MLEADRQALVSLRSLGALQGRTEAGRGTASLRFIRAGGEDGRNVSASLVLMHNDSFELSDIDPEHQGAMLGLAEELAAGAREVRLALHPIQDPGRFNQPRRLRLRTTVDKDGASVLERFTRSCNLLRNYRSLAPIASCPGTGCTG